MRNLFGTDGIRGRVHQYPLTPAALVFLGQAIALWAQEQHTQPHIVLGHDTRESCHWIKAALKHGLLSCALTVADAGILPTPVIATLVEHSDQFTHGIIISASHNSYHDNGIKIISCATGKTTLQDELRISDFMHDIEHKKEHILSEKQKGHHYYWQQATQIYQNYILESIHDKRLFEHKKIILDTANGALYQIAPAVFTALGAQIITLHNKPNGTNINYNCGALHLESLQQAVREHNALVGFAFDGDGDRLMAVTHQCIVKDGDDILALLLAHPEYNTTRTLIGTVMSNQALEHYCTQKNIEFIRTAVGDKYIAQALINRNLLLGGEPSGHIILRNYLSSGDGLLAAVKLMQILVHTANWDMHTFDKYPQIITALVVKEKKNLESSPIQDVIQEHMRKLTTGRILVRYSGTEPLLRIMVEEQDPAHALYISNQLTKSLQDYL